MILGKSKAKASLICLTKEDKNILGSEVPQRNLLLYKADNMFKTEIGKIIQSDVTPIYILVKGDNILACLDTDELTYIEDLINNSKAINYKHNKGIEYINKVLDLYRIVENNDTISTYKVSYLDSLIRKENLFYGKFLLAKLYNHIDKEKAYELYHDLWENATNEEIRWYPDEYLEVMREKDRVIYVKKEDIKFDYTTFDFGKVKSHEEVECKFYFANQSNINFMIYGITSTCGCTIPSWNKKTLKPGDRDSILVRLKVNEKSNIIKTITVKGNTDEVIRLQVKATII